jgi:hypothetical protein
MPNLNLACLVVCNACKAPLPARAEVHQGGGYTFLVEPCKGCLTVAEDLGYERGYEGRDRPREPGRERS